MATPANTDRVWRFGVFEVDTRRLELRRSGTAVKMREQSFRILIYLLEHAGEIVTREELRKLLWIVPVSGVFRREVERNVQSL